ncbi:MAG: pyruvate:ferredoxin (flavodoxin) oxidoreductase [Peptoniphilaceae bacterium]|nr:pyruvate:ferredoxin (flavodoxin) oxidoreductase [Peptoniphilaceae bacterium]MCI6660165.1 pyruvate:ferredoxin (flavodoxin) oxidoreductase [Peptoniphilaceae bacterium]MDD7433482.1 pyruvate:ferredoxin (flavodoxin) oxidoreductase [Peptoniphilaceae bacterium]MDY3076248.1 pyruvate:ferredoxin (flavodoxin) oxidoreductase [Peptoniphilaceae bacterium]MDY4196377.1 pyruvate:ferredoxin (flavodoxin) oxidoreductase [Peptoniphilaceae bacterium]
MVQKFKTMDGNEAAAYVSYAFTEVATIYPITPSSPMPEHVDTWAANGMKNLFGKPVKVVEMQSEAGAAGAVHGALSAGSLTTTYTASQGLLLMIPNMFKIAGEQLPGVFHVAARAVASQALSIYGDHSDINAARMTGFAFLCSSSVQEAMDLGAVAHLAAIEGSLPFCHFFDGFRTSHEIDKIQVWDFEDLRDMINLDKVKEFRARSLNPNRPKTYGTAQSPDVFFQNVEASNSYYTDIIPVVEKYMAKVSEKTGRSYHLFDYYGDPQAEHVVVLMGSVAGAMQEVVDHLREKEGKKVGVVVVRLYRPFSAKHLLAAIPETATRITVLDRTKEKGALGEPLLMDVQSAFYSSERHPLIVGGRYGLGSKDTTPTHLLAVFRNMEKDEPKNHFTIGIEDDVTHLSLDQSETLYIAEEGTKRCKFWGFGSDGTVGANKQAIKIIGDNTDMYAQGYFDYDSKKSGGLTVSHLRFGKLPIRSTYLLDEADFISCSKQAYVHQYDLLRGLKKGGTFLLNCTWTPEELDEHLPGQMKRALAEKNIEFYLINATGIAQELGLGSRTNMIMQSAFFELSKVLPIEEAVAHLKDSIVKAYGHKGDDVVQMNYNAVDRGISALQKVEVPAEWANAKDDVVDLTGAPEFFTKVVSKMLRHEGDDLPVSAFADRPDGHWDNGTTAYEKRGIAVFNPEWQIENCIQCNQCSYVCPHAAIRPFLLNEEEAANAPEGFETKKAIGKGLEGLSFRIQVSQLDCTGCGNCADVCPAKEKALIMKPFEEQYEQQKGFWTYANEKVGYKEDLMDVNTVKGTQFKQPLMEFSGACAGCGETPYVKLVTQLFGDHMMIANATGCSSIWGASAPATPYTVNACGEGPSWGNSLFEDAAEYGYGQLLSAESNREYIATKMNEFKALNLNTKWNELFDAWIEGSNDYKASKKATVEILNNADEKVDSAEGQALLQDILDMKDYMIKKSVWIFGGDGWAYDIGYGGLDHVLASGKDINILVLNTEVYSNTGGQASKATPIAAIAQFAAAGKRIQSKDLGRMQSSYGYVYCAQVAMGANQNQTLKAIREAESYNGPSLVIAYAPCINHGIRIGMGRSQRREKQAVEAGYWHLWRFDPRLADEGKNPFQLDSKEPTGDFQEFLQGEVRYSSLKRNFPDVAQELYDASEKAAKERYKEYVRLANMEY